MASTDYSLRRSRLPRVRGGTRRPFLLVATALFVALMGSNMATPLYAVYRERYGFSAVVLTLIFAIYAAVLVPSLLFFGQLSDRFGRRPAIVAGLVGGLRDLRVRSGEHPTPRRAWEVLAPMAEGRSTVQRRSSARTGNTAVSRPLTD